MFPPRVPGTTKVARAASEKGERPEEPERARRSERTRGESRGPGRATYAKDGPPVGAASGGNHEEMDFATAADELYGVPPQRFTAERRRLAAGLPREDARRLTALRRPTVSAWAVNLLVRDNAVGPLLELGERIREAWSSGGDVGELERERGSLVDRLVRRARTLAEAAGRPLGETFVREVEDTLQAAIADPSAADAVRAGRLDHPLRHAGFGPLPAGPPAAAPGRKTAKRRPTPPKEDPRSRARRLEEAARAAARAAEEAERTLAHRRSEKDEARRAFEEAERRVAELTERLRAARAERDDRERRMRVAEREYARAARGGHEARRRADEAGDAAKSGA